MRPFLPSNLSYFTTSQSFNTERKAYRLEPLILKHYSDVIPLKIHKYDQTRQVEMTYGELPIDTYSGKKKRGQDELGREKNNNGSDSESNLSASPSPSPSKSSASITNRLSFWARWSKKSAAEECSTELEVIEREAKELELKMNQSQEKEQYNPEEGETDLEHRLDYQLREKSMENTYLAVLTAHTSYWTNPDIGLFILTQLHPEYRANTS